MTVLLPVGARCTSSGRRYSPACGVQPQRVGAPSTIPPLRGGLRGRDLRSPLQEQGTKMPRHRWCPSTRWQGCAHFRAAIGVLCMSKARRSSSVAVSNRKREEEIDRQGRRTQSIIRALLTLRRCLRVPRLTAEKQDQRFGVPALRLRLAAKQRAKRLLIVSISALQKAREQGRLIAAPMMLRTTSELFAPANSGDPHPARGGARPRPSSLKTCPPAPMLLWVLSRL
jgi:hypothetical protein